MHCRSIVTAISSTSSCWCHGRAPAAICPTPPPNQIVLVTPAKPYKMAQAYEPVSVTGVLNPGMEKSQLFILDGVSIVQSGYTVRKAAVAHVDTVPDTVTLPVNSPWSFLNKKRS